MFFSENKINFTIVVSYACIIRVIKSLNLLQGVSIPMFFFMKTSCDATAYAYDDEKDHNKW